MIHPAFPTEKIVVYLDFDNTITDFDVLDSVIAKFATGTAWQEAEREWEKGNLGARDCLDLQMRSLRVTPDELDAFVAHVRVDPAFIGLLTWLRKHRIEHSILSDNFTSIIARILTNNHIEGVPIYANAMRFEGDRIKPSFPFYDETCPRCAHCKKVHLLEQTGAYIIYVGDGRSDICPALIADRVYARSFLLDYLNNLNLAPLPFNDLSDVLQDLEVWSKQPLAVV